MEIYTISLPLRLFRLFYSIPCIAIISSVLLAFSTTSGSAQTTLDLTATVEQINQWKSPVDYSTVVTKFQVSTDEILANQNLQGEELALYTGFRRLLDYIHEDLIANVPLADIADKNFKRVLNESKSDPVLIALQPDAFNTMFDGLLGKLYQ